MVADRWGVGARALYDRGPRDVDRVLRTVRALAYLLDPSGRGARDHPRAERLSRTQPVDLTGQQSVYAHVEVGRGARDHAELAHADRASAQARGSQRGRRIHEIPATTARVEGLSHATDPAYDVRYNVRAAVGTRRRRRRRDRGVVPNV